MNTAAGTSGRPRTVARDALTRNLENLALLAEEALGEFWLGAGSGDVRLCCAAARRLQSLGFLMGEGVRRFERQ